MRCSSENGNGSPTQCFGGNCFDIRQLWQVLKGRKPVVPHNPVKFFLGFGDKLSAELDTCKNETGNRAR